MNSFSISACEHQPILEYYNQWLVHDLYANMSLEKLDDPTFLQKLSIIQADGIRRDLGLHAAITSDSIRAVEASVGRKIQSVANLVTLSLEEGFTQMNLRQAKINSTLNSIDKGIGTVNNNLVEGNRLLSQNNREIRVLNQNMVAALSVINSNISQITTILKLQLQQFSNVLQAILDELKIPESQRERRYHIEEGIKYFNMGMKTGDCSYFEDALDEFSIATSIERKDYFSWYYIGMIHLYSKKHINIEKAKTAFERYLHYAATLGRHHELYYDAFLMKAECYYLEHDFTSAFHTIEVLFPTCAKAVLRGIKYLSATGIPDKQVQAVGLLKDLMRKNPYIVMQILEDYDIMCNNYIINFLEEYNGITKKEISALLVMFNQEMERLLEYPISYYEEVAKELYDLESEVSVQINDIRVVDAIALKEKIQAMNMLDRIIKAEKQAKKKVTEEALRRSEEEAQKKAKEEAHKRRELAKKRKLEHREYLKVHGYIDLGLPSGTLWKNENEKGFYSFDDARKSFGCGLPNKKEWQELKEKCQWLWVRSLFRGGYKITGPNGVSIFLPADGLYIQLDDDSKVYGRLRECRYLSNTTEQRYWDDDDGYKSTCVSSIYFNSTKIENCFYKVETGSKFSVRLSY